MNVSQDLSATVDTSRDLVVQIGPPAHPVDIESIQYHLDIKALIKAYRNAEHGRPSHAGVHPTLASVPELEAQRLNKAPWENVFILKNNPTTTLGSLDKLPLEIIQEILGHVDMATLLALRFTSRGGAQVVQSLPIWKTIDNHLPFLLPLLLQKTASTAQHMTANMLHNKLHQQYCDSNRCGHAGNRINLLSCERFCRSCAMDHRFQIFRLSDAMKLWNLPPSARPAVEKLPTIANKLLQTCDQRPAVPPGYVIGHQGMSRINLQA